MNRLTILLEDLNILDLLFVCALLLAAFIMQIVLQELPCPLCLLQRFGMLTIAAGYLLNIRFGVKTSHYGLAILGAIFTAFIAMRQILLHIVPGTGAYGGAVFGLHLYTWVFLFCVLLIIVNVIMISIDRQFTGNRNMPSWLKGIAYLLITIMCAMSLMQVASTYLECGFKQCPDNPTHYVQLDKILHLSN